MDKKGFIKRAKVSELDKQVENNEFNTKLSMLVDSSEVILKMRDYEDIFSDFDPRPDSKRALSDDFLMEAQKASREKSIESIELRLLFLKKVRDHEKENVIRKRLHDHFARHYLLLSKEMKGIIKHGIIETVIGALMLAFSTYVSILTPQDFWHHLVYILFQPAGWFISWYGLDEIFYSSKNTRKDLNFYEKMHRSKIVFDYF